MQNWSYAINSLYKTGSVILEEAPWYIFAIANVAEWTCYHVPAIPFPSIVIKDEDRDETTLKDYYGDLRQWWHVKMHDPVIQWTESKKQAVHIETGYTVLKEKFYDGAKNFFDENEELTDEIESEE